MQDTVQQSPIPQMQQPSVMPVTQTQVPPSVVSTSLPLPTTQPALPVDGPAIDNGVPQPYLPPTSLPHIEHESLPPIGRGEWNTLSEPQPQLSPEAKEVGVEVVQPTLQVPVQAQVLGVTPAKETTPMVIEPEVVHTPITLLKALDILKTDKNNEDSFRWFATLIVREIAVAQMKKQQQKV